MNSTIDELNEKHLCSPQKGDRWFEMCNPTCLILDSYGDVVVIVKKTKVDSKGFKSWDIDKKEIMFLEDFKKWLRYPHTSRTWSDVSPKV